MRLTLIVAFLAIFHFSKSQDPDKLLRKIDFMETNDPDSINLYFQRVFNVAEGRSDFSLRDKAIIKHAGVLLLLYKYADADSLIKLITTPLEIGDQVELHRITGNILSEQNQNDESLKEFYAALDLARKNNLVELEPEIYFDLAAVVRKNNDLKTVTKYYRSALNQAIKLSDIDLEVRANIQLCKVYNGWIVLNLDSSVYYGERAIALAQKAKYEYGYAHALSMAAAPFIRVGQNQRGIQLSREALSYAEKYDFPLITKYYLTANQGFAFKNLKMYDSALFYMKEAGKIRSGSLDYPRLKYQVLKAQGKYKEAIEALEYYSQKTDSIQRSRNVSKLSSMQARYEANLKEEELKAEKQLTSLQQSRLDQQRYLIIGMVVIVFLLVFALALVFRQRKLKKQKTLSDLELAETQKLLDLERQYRASELKALRSQMNPHFVFNALNSIQEYIMTNERKLAGKYLGKFADLMRIYLQHSQVKSVTIREETEALNLYLELEKLRFEDSLTYSINIGNRVNTEQLIPSLLLQPYVENAVKHGLLHKESERVLTINIKSDQGNVLVCEIIDNGVGRKKSQEINKMRNPGHKSFATQATTSRLGLLNLDREQPIEEEVLDMTDDKGDPEGTKVIIRIPMTMEAQNDLSEVGTQ
ncbi:tetratricopeptide repeat-containing sensor histidine kinase [Ekhidna sp.]|uniref:tetratricopeptide repeat-containing sensor histidine kinase n=1 Tax=Ekhidna sp. TaxID=2608089 RepID=UPI003CCBA28B